MRRGTRLFLAWVIALSVVACKPKKTETSPMFGQPESELSPSSYDLSEVQAAGELIAVTLSGPDTYYEYRGQGFGLQFSLAEAFATSIGAKLRMEMAQDTAQLLRMLNDGEADLVALEIDSAQWASLNRQDANSEFIHTKSCWLVRNASTDLAESINHWWNPERRSQLMAAERQRRERPKHRTMVRRPAMLSRKDGIISPYDDLFMRHSHLAGWDWRLLASQCYQESGFDPQAVSWAGAQGLMQIMPATAAHLGLARHEVFDPAHNIEAATRYLRELTASFSDIPIRAERISFVLAAYNGGAGHVRDAMALAAKNGRDAHRWADVNTYILALAEPQYYRDPVVQNGYLRGSETSEYVRQILARWASYRGSARAVAPQMSTPGTSRKALRKWSKGEHHIRPRSSFLLDSLKFD